MDKGKRHHDLPQRSIVNGISLVALGFFIFISSFPRFRWLLTLATAAIAGIALWEYYQLVRRKGVFPAVFLGILAVVCYLVAVFLKTQDIAVGKSFFQNAPEIILGITLFACFVFFTFAGKPAITHIATTFLGIIYIGIPLGLVIRIMFSFPDLQGSWWIIYLIAVTKSADTGGYFIGRRFGRHKFAKKLSPNKTIEGALGGLGAAILMSLLICIIGRHLGYFEGFSYFTALFLGGLLGIVGQMGDLAESLLKRDAQIKDSNRIPGVGGILDMIDSILFTAPVLFLYLKFW